MRTDLPHAGSHYAALDCGPPEAAMEPMVVELMVPDDAFPGTKLEYIAPDGQELRLTVPDGVPPGSIMTLTQDPHTGSWRCMAEPGDRQEPSQDSPQGTTAVPEATYATAGTTPAPVADAPVVMRYPAHSQGGSSTSSAARPVVAAAAAAVPAGHRVPTTLTYQPPLHGTSVTMRPSYTPPPAVQAAVAARPSYTPPAVVQATCMTARQPSYVPPVTVQPTTVTMRPSYTPPIVVEQRHSYVPPPVVIRDTRPSYTPPQVSVMEQRPSYTPLPQVLGGAPLPIARVSQPAADAHIMATTVTICPQHLGQQLGMGQAPAGVQTSYVPPPVQPLMHGTPSYVPPPIIGPSINTLPSQDHMPMHPMGPQMGMPPHGQHPGSAPAMGMQQMAPHMGTHMAAPQLGLPHLGMPGPFIQPQINLPPMGLLSAPPPLGQGQSLTFPVAGGGQGQSLTFPVAGHGQSMSFQAGGGNGMMGAYVPPELAGGMGGMGGHLGAPGQGFGGYGHPAFAHTAPGQMGASVGGHAGLYSSANQPPMMACA